MVQGLAHPNSAQLVQLMPGWALALERFLLTLAPKSEGLVSVPGISSPKPFKLTRSQTILKDRSRNARVSGSGFAGGAIAVVPLGRKPIPVALKGQKRHYAHFKAAAIAHYN
ncbi:hypothetical protein GGTG_12592 [Gaeumannomyces tritici R3-111a-1]|uniref:Uncharacterized protein n=1 Tax=Gaeumannomyces tritici (strain R3-111a-1) TaxID=644352 RepID=J3PGG7_GAET3|nr:hypothetical protein GGTG_12592 [Gaeumannomyces tritici R3-111a-1]EJT69709.1 hypothetical protein GGTG_12592 [Gaeumannomyces tritici R3-111a-1]